MQHRVLEVFNLFFSQRLSGTSYFRDKTLQVGKVVRQYNPFKSVSFPHYVPGKGWEV